MSILPMVYVRVLDSDHECFINESDFDESLHERIDEPNIENSEEEEEEESGLDILDGVVNNVIERLGYVTSITALDTLEARERSGLNRVTILRAMHNLRQSLQTEGEEEEE